MTSTKTAPTAPATAAGSAAARMLALCRILLGFVFLWPALDKSFGLGYATSPDSAWLTTGSSPTAGYLGHVEGPLAGFFGAIAGPVSDVLFIAGMLGTGVALLLGIGLRVAAVSGTLLMTMLWLSAWTFAPGSNNPLVDTHVIYAALVITLAVTRAGDVWGLGRAWAASGVVSGRAWLR
ncbi:DoxX family protein [Myceligenerans xiligouense]|uniref:Thiosulfate dehydrogenase [quinone] large subunit n=1 Tax=Myceligenerans xiligouense TaxID=253184 RepID=A0A3N4YP62_9MICO|nr:DoxX family protein [Myceligenerans xiligouense]RPF20270.1 thiosulfate dehydrogenase [quinone] large subunit [Myceligenerans xiligouense]